MRSFRLSLKHLLLSACLLLVMLGSGMVVQIAAQSRTWEITLGIDVTNSPFFDLLLLVNGMSFCIPNFPFSPSPERVISLDGLEVYEGTCSAHGVLPVGPISGILALGTSGPGPFSVELVYTVGFPGLMSYHSEWSFTGLWVSNGVLCTLQNVVSDASLRGTGLGGIGLDVDLHLLRLEPDSGDCRLDYPIVWLPTFVYYVSPAPVLCAIQLGVQDENGNIAWLPGYAYPNLLASQCQNKTDYYTDVLGRTIVIHQFNQTIPL